MVTQVKTGTVTGTGAAINVAVGFSPSVIHIFNKTDPGFYVWTKDMDDAAMVKLTDAPALTAPTSNGVTPYAGAIAATSEGFTIGADTDMNAASDVLYWVAWS